MVGDESAGAFGMFERALLARIAKALATEAVDGQDVAAMRRTCQRLLAGSLPWLASAVRSELSKALVDDAVRDARIAGIAVPDSMAASAEAAAASCAASSRAVAGSMADDAVSLYISAKQTARMRMRRGADDAVRSTVADLAERGLTAYSYVRRNHDGTTVQVDVPVDVGIRRTVCDTFYARAQAQSVEIAGESTGLVEVSFSRSPRKSHAEWQGRVYAVKPGGRYPYFDDACHVGDPVDGFGGYNCQHELRVYDPRIGRMFSDPLEGTGYTRDEARRAVGRQRRLENDIRKLKRRRNALEDSGLDIGNTDALIRARQAELRTHIAENSAILRRERWREQVAPNKADTIRADDVFIPRSLSASAKPTNVRMPDGTMARLSEGTKITGVKVIAGKGVKRNIDDIDYLVCRYGGKRGGWQKKRGTAFVDDLGMSRKCEIHWYEEESVGAVEHKLKRFYY